ncbi:MAG TPA: hypothetical protein VGR95_13755 [Thermoanaerobaculia bacterium]|jgi:hypothetical protein|nr:hypothetical protein [Thermoanaerobaculia bacterium]
MGATPSGSIFDRVLDREGRDEREAATRFASLPVREQMLDRLADLMLDTDDILEFLESDAAGELRTITPDVERLFHDVNRLMHRLSD